MNLAPDLITQIFIYSMLIINIARNPKYIQNNDYRELLSIVLTLNKFDSFNGKTQQFSIIVILNALYSCKNFWCNLSTKNISRITVLGCRQKCLFLLYFSPI